MTAAVSAAFVAGPAGHLATVTWTPARVRARMLYVPPFAEEMNKSRRMVALQARAFAAAGIAVTVLDPRGTGDSAGEHEDATWAGWRDDVAAAWRGIAAGGGPCLLWGLRLGALLAADAVASRRVDPVALLLWQPVASGRTFFAQWLRMAGDGARGARAALAEGRTLDVAGYGIAPGLVAGAEAAQAECAARPGLPVVVREVSLLAPPSPLPATQALAQRWQAAGAAVDVAAVSGPSFWAAVEIEEAPALVASTTVAIEACLDALAATNDAPPASVARSLAPT